jgi:hypothetical protein
MTATLLSVNVAMPKDVSWLGRTVYTAVWKHPVTGLSVRCSPRHRSVRDLAEAL